MNWTISTLFSQKLNQKTDTNLIDSKIGFQHQFGQYQIEWFIVLTTWNAHLLQWIYTNIVAFGLIVVSVVVAAIVDDNQNGIFCGCKAKWYDNDYRISCWSDGSGQTVTVYLHSKYRCCVFIAFVVWKNWVCFVATLSLLLFAIVIVDIVSAMVDVGDADNFECWEN